MRKIWLLSVAPLALLTNSIGTQAADLVPVLSAPPPAPITEWSIEGGMRYWYSEGRYQKDLFDPFTPTRLNSRLSYDSMTGHAGEAFARFDHRSGIFIKANLGIGNLVDGTLHDEDFPAFVFYSNTVSEMKDGRMRYGSADVGWNALSSPLGKVGGYIGYRYFYERGNGFGCRQIATDAVCVPTIPTSFLGLSETETWRGVALGLNTQMNLTPQLRLEVDAAVLPYVDRSGFDNHWFRADINPQMESGRGWGAQFETVLSYAVTPHWNVGVGGRYWYFTTTEAHTQFPGVALDSPMKFSAERYGGFLQASYKLDGGFNTAPAIVTPVWNWTGLYFGGHLGGGWGRTQLQPTSGFFGFVAAPGWGDVDGFIGGGQAGINYQIANWVLGVEGEYSWSDLDGYAPCDRSFYTCHNRVDEVATLAGRFGYAYGNLMFFTKAGGAWAQDKHDMVRYATANLFNADVTRTGWLLGSGLEYAFTPDWSAKIEYSYMDFGNHSVPFTDQFGNIANIDVDQVIQDVKVGVNYRFNWAPAPVVAKY
jgi:opacity protein-like surface antigen